MSGSSVGGTMIALTVTPGMAGSLAVEEVPDVIAAEGQVLVRTLELGVCGTDRSIGSGLYGSPPEGADQLVIGHEVLGEVVESRAGLERGTLVSATVRRSCHGCESCDAGEVDSCMTGGFRERGIVGLDGFASERFVERSENLVGIPRSLGRLGVLAEPMSIAERGLRQARVIGGRQPWRPRRAIVLGTGAIGMLTVYLLRLAGVETWAMARSDATGERAALVGAAGARYVSTKEVSLTELASELGGPDLIMEATGSPELVAEAVHALGPNGVLCVRGISSAQRPLTVDATTFTDALVLQNKAVFGSTNAGRQDWHRAVDDLEAIARRWHDSLEQMIGRTVPVERFAEAIDHTGSVKATIRFAT